MTGFRLSLLAALLAVAISHKIAPVEKNFNEIISVNLKKANEDIRFVVSSYPALTAPDWKILALLGMKISEF